MDANNFEPSFSRWERDAEADKGRQNGDAEAHCYVTKVVPSVHRRPLNFCWRPLFEKCALNLQLLEG